MIVPDDKDWTFVLERPCPECGFDAKSVADEAIAGLLAEVVGRWPGLLRRTEVRRRPDESTWSALEYGCHVRDVYRIFARRLELMRREDDPLFPNWDQDATALAEHYDRQDPEVVAAEILESGVVLTAAFAVLPRSEWERTGRRSDGAVFTIASLGRYLLHDPFHHVVDVERGYGAIARTLGEA